MQRTPAAAAAKREMHVNDISARASRESNVIKMCQKFAQQNFIKLGITRVSLYTQTKSLNF